MMGLAGLADLSIAMMSSSHSLRLVASSDNVLASAANSFSVASRTSFTWRTLRSSSATLSPALAALALTAAPSFFT